MASALAVGGLFVGALGALLLASNAFTSAVERIGLSLGVSPFIVGATVVAGGTSLPELTSSVAGVLEGEPAIVVGNVVGSNVANIFLVLGVVAAVAGRIHIDRELMRVDLPLLVASAVFLAVAVWNGPFLWYEGVLGFGGVAVYAHSTLSTEERLDEVAEELVEVHAPEEVPADGSEELAAAAAQTEAGARTYLVAAGALGVVFVAAALVVDAILEIAALSGVETGVVAVTAVGVGTSLPEAAVSLSAARRGEAEIAVGNVLGSNVFNAFVVMGVPAFLGPITVSEDVRSLALPAMVLATLLYYFITEDREITRWEGAALLLLYGVFLLNLFQAG